MRNTPLFVPSATTLRQARRLLRSWLRERLAPEGLAWLEGACRDAVDGPERSFFMNFSAAARHAPKEPLALDADQRGMADRVRPGWSPDRWTLEQAARTYILLHRDPRNRERWKRELDLLFENGDLGEQVALYQSLPLLTMPQALAERCAEGVRSNVTDVFLAVAHHNPYPSEHLPDRAWNQLVLKALFVEVPLAPIHGLMDRTNAVLSQMLRDHAKERWAARRPVNPELWTVMGPEADEEGVKTLEKAWLEGDEATKAAAAGGLRSCPWPEASWALRRLGLPHGEDLL